MLSRRMASIIAMVVIVLGFPPAPRSFQDTNHFPLRVAGEIVYKTDALPLSIQAIPNDPYYSQQWYLKRIKADQAWNITRGTNMVVAVIDTGVDFNHPDLAGKLWVNTREVPNNLKDDDGNGYIDDYYGYNFINNDPNIDDYHGHGTGIASIIAAATNNGQGVAGINWNARIMVLKALNNIGGGDFGDVAQAIRYAADNGAKIINMSFGSETSSAILSNAVNYAINKGVPMVAAVGNQNGGSVLYPAAYPNVIAVSGVDERDGHPSFANTGDSIDLAAPATGILMAGLVGSSSGGYVEGSGTSFAAAQVTAAASLITGRYQGITPSILESVLKANSDVLSQNAPRYFGSGVLNILKALNSSPLSTSTVSVSNGVLPADGISAARVTVVLQDTDGALKSGREILVRASGPNTIVNGQIVPVADSLSVGKTDSLGRVGFEVSSISVGYKELTFIDNTTQTSLRDKAPLTFTVPTHAKYSMAWVKQSSYPTLNIGGSTELWVEIKNTGNITWISHPEASLNGEGQMKLGTDRALDRSSVFYHGSWLSSNRTVYMTPSVVKPGGIARFTFQILASQTGSFKEYFRPVIEHVTWLNDLGIYWGIKTNPINGEVSSVRSEEIDTEPSHYRAILTDQSSDVTMHPGDTTQLMVTLTNVGTATWRGQGTGGNRLGEIRIGTAQNQDRASPISYLSWISPNRVINAGLDISPGRRLTIMFTIKAPNQKGVYQENFQLVCEYVTWFGPVFGWTITVV